MQPGKIIRFEIVAKFKHLVAVEVVMARIISSY